MRLWLPFCFTASCLIAQPGAATPAGHTEKPAAKPAAIDPESLAVAREIVLAFWPDGTMSQVMNSMSGMQSGMMSEMMNKTPEDLGVSDAEGTNGKTLGELAREKDPYFEERLKISNRVMTEEMGKVMAGMEPQLREAIALIYTRRFSRAQLNDILAFFRTPSGKNYAAQLIPMMSDPAYLQAMSAMMPKIMQAMPAIVEKVKKATAHLPPPPKDDEAVPEKAELPSS